MPLRPILTSLNGDQSWLLSFPRPLTTQEAAPSPGKKYFHVVTDPWLQGEAVVLSNWILGLERSTAAAAGDGAGVDRIARRIEATAAGEHPVLSDGQDLISQAETRMIDAIFIHFHYLDHLHKPSLVTFDPTIPVFAAPVAAETIRAWQHFDSVTTTRDLDPEAARERGWPALHPGGSLPAWLSVFRLRGHAELNFATAIVWSHEEGDSGGDDDGDRGPDQARRRRRRRQWHELVLNSPHGIRADHASVRALFGGGGEKEDTGASRGASSGPGRGALSQPRVAALALLAPLKDSFALGRLTTLGHEGSVALEGAVKPRYWVRSHDMMHKHMGLLMRLAGTRDVPRTLERADGETGDGEAETRRPNLVDIENGDSFVLV